MLNLQQQLETRFNNLQNSRTGPIFFLEHGLSDAELSDLKNVVRTTLCECSFGDVNWAIQPFPLIVIATEVGYRYRGPGTDFWPLIEQELGTQFGFSDRQQMRNLFEWAANKYRGALPPVSPWANAFHLIAWPITHALVPIEFHRVFAATLAKLNISVRDMDDSDFYKLIRSAAGNVSARFDTWLSDQKLVVMVARRLLYKTTGELSEETMSRIAEDIFSDATARRDVAAARRLQRGAQRNLPNKIERDKLPPVCGRLQLRLFDGRFTLEAYFPQINHTQLETTRRILRRRRYAPRFWGVSSRVPSDQFLSGLPFTLKLASPPELDAKLLQGLSNLEIDDQQRDFLRALQLDFNPPILFTVNSDGETAKDTRSKDISRYKRYWILSLQDLADKLDVLPILGVVGPYKCFDLDPSVPASAEVLQWLGYQLRDSLNIGFAGAPPLDRDTPIPCFTEGDTRLVVPKLENPEGTMINLDGEEIELGDNIIKVSIQEGDHCLTVLSQERSKCYRFTGIKQTVSDPNRFCWINLIAPELTVQALLSGNVSLRVESHVPIEGLELTIELELADRLIGVTTILGPLPEIIAGNAELWSILLDETIQKIAIQNSMPILHVRVGALAFGSWQLEQRVSSCWWKHSIDEVSLQSELGALSFGRVMASHPLKRPEIGTSDEVPEAMLLAPFDIDWAVHGTSAEFTTLCIAPSKIKLDAPIIQKPRLKRVRRAQRKTAGLEDLIEAYLRWALAESDSITAEIRRRQMTTVIDSWVSELCCGEEWALREIELKSSVSDPWQLLARTFERTGLGRDPYIELTPENEISIARLSVAEIRRIFPDLWTLIGPPCDLDEEDYSALDLACGRAYIQLANDYKRKGQEDLAAEIAEGDPGTTDDDWYSALVGVKAHSDFHRLAELLLPSDSTIRLLELDYTLMSREDLKDELIRWSHGARQSLYGGVPSEAVLEAILMLWLSPELVVKLDWRSAIDTLIAERAIARSVRYMFLRSQNLSRRGTL